MDTFKLISHYKPTGDQPQAIDELTKSLEEKKRHQEDIASQTEFWGLGSFKLYVIRPIIFDRKMIGMGSHKLNAWSKPFVFVYCFFYNKFKGFIV